MENIDMFLDGKLLYGDDFDANQIEEWFADEKDGYANLGAKDKTTYRYAYHALNVLHAYRHLHRETFADVMGFGGAYGDELLPIISKIKKITIIDPSDSFFRESIQGVPTRYIKPRPEGSLPLENNRFDLITCLGVLHHIPNVSFVVSELARTLKPNGHIVIREPIVSMGDWRVPRRGLTKRERGIPLAIFETIILNAGLWVYRQSLCDFPITPRIFFMFRSGVYNNRVVTKIDALLSQIFARNYNYHARRFLQRLRPRLVFFILKK